jgi:hypothetical protein
MYNAPVGVLQPFLDHSSRTSAFGQRLEIVRVRCLDIGWGVADAIDTVFSESGLARPDDEVSEESDDGANKKG